MSIPRFVPAFVTPARQRSAYRKEFALRANRADNPSCSAGYEKRTPISEICTTALKHLDLRGERIDHSVDGPSRALDRAMRHVLRRNRGVLRHVPCRADRSRLNADA